MLDGMSICDCASQGRWFYGMGYDADSAFTSKGVDRSWNTNIDNLDVQPENKSLQVTWKVLGGFYLKVSAIGRGTTYNRFLDVEDISTIFLE